MRIAYFDCQFGAAGDMLVAALLGAGLPQEEWLANVHKIALPEGTFSVKFSDVFRSSVAAKKIDVECPGTQEERHLCDIAEIISSSQISQGAKALSLAIFERLARAEAQVHGVTPDEVHFHELGAIDAIVDIVGFAIGYHLLGIEASYASPLPLGSGTVSTEHGLFPVPGPAVVNLLKDANVPTSANPIDFECLTPTGAAILTAVAQGWGAAPAMDRIIASGYGAGSKDCPAWPNVSRVVIGDARASAGGSTRFDSEAVAVVEANLDDFSPQSLAYAVERLLEAGALDAYVVPAVMKKGRSGHLLSVVCRPEDKTRIQELILAETSTIGVRAHESQRLVAKREWHEVRLSRGTVRIKAARDLSGKVINAQPEYEDCAAYATRYGVPLKDVLAEAIAEFAKNSSAITNQQKATK